MKKSNKVTFLIIAVVVVGVIGLLGYRNFVPSGEGEKIPCNNPAIPDPTHLHIHPMLKIVVDGKEASIRANIGLEPLGCHRALHTHDEPLEEGFRLLHIEPDFAQDFRLGDFFELWQKPFSRSEVLEHKADAEHEIVMTVDGAPSDAFDDLIFKDRQRIIIEYRKVGQE